MHVKAQMHNLAKNIADQMAKKAGSEFGETFRYNEIYFGKIQVDKNTTESVTIEQFIEGSPFVKYMNNTGRFSMIVPQLLCRRWKHLLIFHIRSAKVSFCWLTYKA